MRKSHENTIQRHFEQIFYIKYIYSWIIRIIPLILYQYCAIYLNISQYFQLGTFYFFWFQRNSISLSSTKNDLMFLLFLLFVTFSILQKEKTIKFIRFCLIPYLETNAKVALGFLWPSVFSRLERERNLPLSKKYIHVL